MIDQWIYFGCHQQPGHYTFAEGMRSYRGRGSRDVSSFDGMLAPQNSAAPYLATISRLGGWGATALSFWDYSVDKRGGCNSIVFAPLLDIEPDEMLSEAMRRFPQVFARLPQPVQLVARAGREG